MSVRAPPLLGAVAAEGLVAADWLAAALAVAAD